MGRDESPLGLNDIVAKLIMQTGISEAQALELIYLIGLNWASLVREAKIMKSGKR